MSSLVAAMLLCIISLVGLHKWMTRHMRKQIAMQSHLSVIYKETEAKRKEEEARQKEEAKAAKKAAKEKAALMRW